MSVFCFVRRFIENLPPRRIFVTRELLCYGDRKSIDWLTCWMVADEQIVRLARGVFMKKVEGMEMPSVQEIAEAKARAFGKIVIPTMRDLASKLDLKAPSKTDRRKKQIPDEEGAAEYSVFGCKGNFKTVHGRVKFKTIAPRKFFLQGERVGETILGMWHATESAVESYDELQRNQRFNRVEKERMMELSAWAPAWLQFYLYPKTPRADIHAPWSIFPMLKNPPPGRAEPSGVSEEPALYVLNTAVQGENSLDCGKGVIEKSSAAKTDCFKVTGLIEYVLNISARQTCTVRGGTRARRARRNSFSG